MKKLLFLLLFLLPFISHAQTVLGVKFGTTTLAQAETLLKKRFGSSAIKVVDNKEILIFGGSIAGFDFRFGWLYFQFVNGVHYANGACFVSDDYNLNTAKIFRDKLIETITSKYECDESVDKDGLKCYWFGTSPFNANNYIGGVIISESDEGKYCIALKYDDVQLAPYTDDI